MILEPFFDSGPTPAPRGRLLLISYYFAPSSATGALRWQRMARFAAERGWGLDVVTLPPSSAHAADASRLAELPPGVRVFGVAPAAHPVERLEAFALRVKRALRPTRGGGAGTAPAGGAAPAAGGARVASFSPAEIAGLPFRARSVLRGYHAWLEYAKDLHWARRAAAAAGAVVQPTVHRAVITCGPPHMAHEAGRLVAARHRLPLVVDLRDPWSLVQRLPEPIASPRWFRIARRFERRVFEQAALVVVNTERAAAATSAEYPAKANAVLAVMNGYDPEVMPAPQPAAGFRIRYAGTIYLDRDPRPLFAAAAAVVRELGLSPEAFGVEFMGYIGAHNGVPVEAIAKEAGLGDYLRTYPPQPRARALEFLAGAGMLVSLPQDSDMAIPAKVFEYMLFDAAILALAEPDSATAQLLRGTGADVVAPGDLPAMTEVIRSRYLAYACGERPGRIAEDPRFSRRTQAARLFDALERIAAG